MNTLRAGSATSGFTQYFFGQDLSQVITLSPSKTYRTRHPEKVCKMKWKNSKAVLHCWLVQIWVGRNRQRCYLFTNLQVQLIKRSLSMFSYSRNKVKSLRYKTSIYTSRENTGTFTNKWKMTTYKKHTATIGGYLYWKSGYNTSNHFYWTNKMKFSVAARSMLLLW